MPYPHSFITLTPEEQARLKKESERLARVRKWKRRLPLQALYLSNEKKTFRDIAEYLGVDYSTVRNWVYRYRKCGTQTPARRGGLEGFIAWVNRPGPKPPR